MELNSDLKVFSPEDCGNAPKKEHLKQFLIALASMDQEKINELVKDDLVLGLVGNQQVVGIEAFNEHVLHPLKELQPKELHITNLITHGKTAASNGYILFTNGRKYHFCDIYQFSSAGKNAKIKEITSYLIKE